MANCQLTNYIIPTTLDTPAIDVIMLENPYQHGPFGAKGVGEMPIDGPAPAVINALRHAGYDLREIPATAERIMNASVLNSHTHALTLTANGCVPAHPMKSPRRAARGLRPHRDERGCGEGVRRAVLVDGTPVNSCLVPVAHAVGSRVTTIEGLNGRHPLQRAFVEHGGAQCGICTPGMIMAAVALGRKPSMGAMRTGLAGNLCRCTGYSAIYQSIRRAGA
jgi:carbon-monoxide dehydrogenase small subunit/xanthine dehydrogenase small subunit